MGLIVRFRSVGLQTPTSDTAYLSASQTALEPALIDDVIELWVGNTLVFMYDYATNGQLEPALLQLTSAQLTQLQGQTVQVIYKNKYGKEVEATPLFLVFR